MPSPVHITPFDFTKIWYDTAQEAVVLQIGAGLPVSVSYGITDDWGVDDPDCPDYDQWLANLLDDLDSNTWLADNWARVIRALSVRGYYMDPPVYADYARKVTTGDGIVVEVDTRVYPAVKLHELTQDRAIHVNVAARPQGAEHRTHIGEAKLRLGENQHSLAYKLVDRICDQLETGQLPLETAAIMELEDLSPDAIEGMLEEAA